MSNPIHPFPARMAPEVALTALDEVAANSIVLDPMCGSGGMTRTYGIGKFSIRYDGPQRDNTPVMFTLLRQDGAVEKHGGWSAVEKKLRDLIGDDLPSFKDSETRVPGEHSRRDQRPIELSKRPQYFTRRRRH